MATRSFSTSRLNFGAALIALGYDPIEIARSPRGDLTFIFDDDGQMARRFDDFLTGRLEVSAVKFIRAQDLVRDLRREQNPRSFDEGVADAIPRAILRRGEAR